MYCQRCGAGNPDGSVRCSACGVALSGSPAANAGVEAKTSGLAIAALVLGILALFTCGITALPAIVCGIIALMRISGSRGLLKGMGLAIIGMALPAVLIVFVPILAAMLMPALAQGRNAAQRAVCAANLKGLSMSVLMYASENHDRAPAPDAWCDLLRENAGVSEQTFRCPAGPEGTCTYAMNGSLRTVSGPDAARLVAIFECSPGWNQAGGPELLTTEYHDGEGCNVAFADGHVAFVRTENLNSLMWTTDQ